MKKVISQFESQLPTSYLNLLKQDSLITKVNYLFF